MICLLCYESNNDAISVDGEHGKQMNLSLLLFKYFKFCFDVSFSGFSLDKFRAALFHSSFH